MNLAEPKKLGSSGFCGLSALADDFRRDHVGYGYARYRFSPELLRREKA
jgi:hypothetical protein